MSFVIAVDTSVTTSMRIGNFQRDRYIQLGDRNVFEVFVRGARRVVIRRRSFKRALQVMRIVLLFEFPRLASPLELLQRRLVRVPLGVQVARLFRLDENIVHIRIFRIRALRRRIIDPGVQIQILGYRYLARCVFKT